MKIPKVEEVEMIMNVTMYDRDSFGKVKHKDIEKNCDLLGKCKVDLTGCLHEPGN